jgi:hypothetical protein
MMMITRRPAILLSLMLAACSSDPSIPALTYVPPSPPTQSAIVAVATTAAAEAKLAAPQQISAVRPTDHGPGQYFICLREANPPPDKRQPRRPFLRPVLSPLGKRRPAAPRSEILPFPTMMARIGVMKALNRHVEHVFNEHVFNPDRKDTHWGKRKLKRDEYTPPSMPTMEALGKGIKQAATEAKLINPMSDFRQTDHGPSSFLLCIRGVESKYRRVVTYAVFFDNDVYKGLRLPVILDDCEKQNYRPAPQKGRLSYRAADESGNWPRWSRSEFLKKNPPLATGASLGR